MSKITKGNIAAARAQRNILVRRGKKVPEHVEQIANLDPSRVAQQQSDQVVAEASPQSPSSEEGRNSLSSALKPHFLGMSSWTSRAAQPGRYVYFAEGSGKTASLGAMYPKFKPFEDREINLVETGEDTFFIVLKDDLGSAGDFIHKSAESPSPRSGSL